MLGKLLKEEAKELLEVLQPVLLYSHEQQLLCPEEGDVDAFIFEGVLDCLS